MPKRNGAVHVATTRRHHKDKVYETFLLRRSYREGGKVKHETLGNLSHLPEDLIHYIRNRLRTGQPILRPSSTTSSRLVSSVIASGFSVMTSPTSRLWVRT